MINVPTPPFSARVRGTHRQVDSDFPVGARVGLLHLLAELIEKGYIDNWIPFARELQRLGRLSPVQYDGQATAHLKQARNDVADALEGLIWERCYDFCERLYSFLARDVGCHNNFGFEVETQKSDVQAFISDELQRLFAEEQLAYDFSDGMVRRRGRKHSVDIATRAQVVLGDPRLVSARKHYDKALQFFRDPRKPDFENTVKEAVCAVEAAGKTLYPAAKASTLGELAKWLGTNKERPIPKALAQTITGIYAYRSGGDGVGHGGADGGVATLEVAEYVLAVSASQIIYLVDVASTYDENIPF